MQFHEVDERIRHIPWLGSEPGRAIYDHVIALGESFTGPINVLELGFSQGRSSCYIAAALDQLAPGSTLTTVDLECSADRTWVSSTIEDALEMTGLRNVSVHRERNSYTWFLKKEIEKLSGENAEGRCGQRYHFCFVDGPKNWTTDGFAFFLVDKLLYDGGSILFDDYSWSYAEDAFADPNGIQKLDGISANSMSKDQLEQPNVQLVCDLLVRQHGSYDLRVERKPGPSGLVGKDEYWAWAMKKAPSK